MTDLRLDVPSLVACWPLTCLLAPPVVQRCMKDFAYFSGVTGPKDFYRIDKNILKYLQHYNLGFVVVEPKSKFVFHFGPPSQLRR